MTLNCNRKSAVLVCDSRIGFSQIPLFGETRTKVLRREMDINFSYGPIGLGSRKRSRTEKEG